MSHVKKEFVHLHCHSDYSLLDGSCRINELILKAKHLGMRSIALTDHGNMFGAIEFYSDSMKHGIKPLVGMEAYVAPYSRFEKSKTKGQEESAHHITLLCKNDTGYKNLIQLSTLSYRDGFYYRPRMDREILQQYHEGLIALSGCPQSEFGRACTKKDFDGAVKIADELSSIFSKEDFYLEIQGHGIEMEPQIVEGALRASQALGLKVVATNDVHYINKEDHKAHDVLLAINTGTTIFDEKRLKYSAPEFYLKSPDEMYASFDSDLQDALKTTLEIAEKCNLEIVLDELHLPRYKADGTTPQDLLKDLCLKGFKRYKEVTPEVTRRLEHELSIIEKMGFASYFLIVADFARFARENGIIVGPGRGSAAGSIIAYLLEITDIDPLRYGLIFERFLNPGRRELPDIDMDFAPEDRQKIIDYIKSRYGSSNVSQIITFTIMKARLVIRDVSRAMGIDLKVADTIAKRIPMSQIINITLKKTLQDDSDLNAFIEQDPKLKEMFTVAMSLEGLKRHCSKHAGGIVITDKPITNYTPIFVSRESEETTQYGMDSLQRLGLLKIDILGVETLSILDKALKLIEKQKQVKISLDQIPLDDKLTYEVLGKGLIRGVFQLEGSRSARDLIKRMSPDRIEDILAAVALNRPGPMQSGMVHSYIEVKHNRQKADYMHKVLEDILQETNGAILYQEQVMMIANRLAGFTMAEADKLRKAMGKKDRELMEEYGDKFLKGAIKNGFDKSLAKDIFEKIMYFAGYGFNKSHSAAYGLISYYTAYLKANFPVEFMTVLFSSNISKPEKIAEYLDECKKLSIEVLPPDINESDYDFKISDNRIRFGLGVVKNLGSRSIEAIMKVREEKGGIFSSFQDFCESISQGVIDKRGLEQLIKCGAFDSLGHKRKSLLDRYDELLRLCGVKHKEKMVGQLTFFGAGDNGDSGTLSAEQVGGPSDEELTDEELLTFEKQALGVWVRSNPMEKYEIVSEFLASTTVDGISDVAGKNVTVVGVVSNIRLKVIHSGPRRGAHYALVNIQDLTGNAEGVLFPTSLARNRKQIEMEDRVMLIRGSLDERDDARSLIVHEMIPIDEAIEGMTEAVVITLCHDHREEDLDTIKEILSNHKGDTKVVLEITSSDKEKTTVGLSMQYSVRASNGLALDLEGITGRDKFRFVMKKWTGK